jgi:hypothetical protein
MSISRLTEIWEPRMCAPADQETTNDYVDVAGSTLDAEGKSRVVFTIKNTDGANSLTWKVLASIDNSTYVEVKAEATLAAAAISSFEATAVQAAYRYFKIQVKATVGGSQGDAQVRGYAKI